MGLPTPLQCCAMRRVLLLLPLLAVLAACRGTQAYTAEDLAQVKEAYNNIPPIYIAFKRVYYGGDTAGILAEYHKAQAACRVEDAVDKRDTIDPNTNLFAASSGLDSLCNDMDSAYVQWAKQHHYPYDKSIVPGRREDVFVDGDANLLKMPKQMEHPAAFA